jgi:arabinofuranosyltransferase
MEPTCALLAIGQRRGVTVLVCYVTTVVRTSAMLSRIRRVCSETWAATTYRTSRLGWTDWLTIVVLGAVCAGAMVNSSAFKGSDFDDAYITFRHSENLARGHGPVYNVGQHVEGTSAFLFMVLIAAFISIGTSPMAAATALSVLSFVGLVLMAYATVRLFVPSREGRFLGVGAAASVASMTPLAYYSQTGMETLFYAFLLGAAVYLHLRWSRHADGSDWPWAVVMGLAAITRPEGFLYFFLLLGLVTVARLGSRRSWRSLAGEVAVSIAYFSVVFVPVIVFRVFYYHSWVPNSVVAKSGAAAHLLHASAAELLQIGTSGQGAEGAKAVAAHLGLGAFALFGAILSSRTRYAFVVIAAVAASCVALLEWNEGDWMPHGRLLTPALMPLSVGIAIGLRGILFQREQRTTRLGYIACWLVAATVFWSVADGSRYERAPKFSAEVVDYMKWVGRTLDSIRQPGDVLATDMAGYIPYYSHIETIDTLGLCEPYIARHGTRYGEMGKLDQPYVIAKRPTFWQLNFTSAFRDLYREPSFAPFAHDYWAIITPAYLRYPGGDRKLLLVRKDRPDLKRLVAAFGARLVEPQDELARLGQAP